LISGKCSPRTTAKKNKPEHAQVIRQEVSNLSLGPGVGHEWAHQLMELQLDRLVSWAVL
jgi:hypothetical protein